MDRLFELHAEIRSAVTMFSILHFRLSFVRFCNSTVRKTYHKHCGEKSSCEGRIQQRWRNTWLLRDILDKSANIHISFEFLSNKLAFKIWTHNGKVRWKKNKTFREKNFPFYNLWFVLECSSFERIFYLFNETLIAKVYLTKV